LYDRDEQEWSSLSCNEGTFRLECKVPNFAKHEHRFNVFTADSLYDSGAVSGPVELIQCKGDGKQYDSGDPCQKPSIWRVNTPVEANDRKSWTMSVELQGACPGDPTCINTMVSLTNPANRTFKPVVASPPSGHSQSDLRVFKFNIPVENYSALGEVMAVEVEVKGVQSGYSRIGPVLSAVSPIVRSITKSDDGKSTEITGINLIFSGVRVGPNGAPFKAICSSSNGLDWCSYPADLGATAGPVFFALQPSAGGTVVAPLRQLASDGVAVGTAITYTPTPKKSPADVKTPGGNTTTITITTGSPTTSPTPSTAQVGAQMALVPALTASFFTGATSSSQGGDQTSVAPNQNPTQMYIVPQ
jgi:hypothetical protein